MKRKTLALLLAAALTVTSVEGTAVMADAADFTSEFTDDTSGSDEIELSDSEAQDSSVEESEISVFEDSQDSAEEENIEITDESDSVTSDEEEEEIEITDEAELEFSDGGDAESDIEVFSDEESAPKLISIEADGVENNPMLEGATGIDYYVAADITLTFEDGTTSNFIFPLGATSYSDPELTRGYTIEASVREKPLGQKLPGGNYQLYFTCGDVSTSVPIYIRSVEETGIYQRPVETGDNLVFSYENTYRYYKFVPGADGIYEGNTNSANCVPWLEKTAEDGSKSYEKLDGFRWQLNVGDSVYFQIYGGKKDAPSQVDTNLNLKQVRQLSGIEATQSEVTLLEDYETYYGDAISNLLRFNYTNQETEEFDVKFGYAMYRDSDGNTVMSDFVYADGENEGEPFDWRNARYVPKGSYKYVFTLTGGEETATAEVPIKVESLADRYDRFAGIQEGTQEIDITGRQFYKFEPEVTGSYVLSAPLSLSYYVMEVNADGTVSDSLAENTGRLAYNYEQGKKYIIEIYNRNTDGTSMNLTLERAARTESVEIVSYTPQNLKFIEGQAPEFNFIKVRINTEKGSKVVKLRYGGISGEETDQYGKTLEYSLYKKENDQYTEMDYDDVYSLEAGEYVYRVFYDGIEAETSIPVHISSFAETAPQDRLEEGESKILSAKDNQISASYLARFTGRHQFEFNKDVDVYFVSSDTGEKNTYSNVSEFCETLMRGNVYYLYITSDTGLEDLQIKVTALAAPTKMEVLADNNEYTAGIDRLSTMNLRTRVTYSDGSEQIIKENDPVYGGWLSYRASSENGKTAENYSELSEGVWTCVPYIYGQGGDVSLRGTEITGAEIQVTMPDPENLEALEEGVAKTVEPVKRKFYKFTPATSGNYETTVSDGSTANVYSVYNGRLSKYGRTPYLIKDETYFIMISTPYSVDLQIKKSESTGDDSYVMGEKYDQTFDIREMEGPIWFTFEAAETGYYKFWTEGNSWPYVALYEDGDQIDEVYPYMTANVSLTAKLEKGKTYDYVVDWDPYDGSDLTVHFAATEHQAIKSLALVLKKGVTEDAMTVMNEVLDVYDLQINYADHSVLVEDAMRSGSWDSYDYDGTDEYGNKWRISVNESKVDVEAKDTQYEIDLGYYDPEEGKGHWDTVQIPVKGTEGIKGIENGVSVKPFQNNGLASWFAFTPAESGEYILQNETEEGEMIPDIYICAYNVVKYSNVQYVQQNTVRTEWLNENSASAMLTEGETYLVEISRRNMDCNRDISFKIEKAKKVKNVVIKKAPDQISVYNTDGNIETSLEGLVLTVYYTDGTEEDVAYGETDTTGHGIAVEYEHWKDADTYTVDVSLRGYYLQVDYKRMDLPDEIQEMTVGSSTTIPASDKVVVPVMFTPEKTGYYFVDVENGSVSSVQKLATLPPKQARIRRTEDSSDADDTQYFEENNIYLIYIYTNKKEATVTIREGACKWETIAGTVTKVSCTTGESYKQECKVHDHTRVVEGDKAVGHAYGSWKVTREADCTAAEEQQRTCIYCGHVEKKQTAPAKGHEYDSWKVTKEATVLNMGQQERTCSVCHKKETKSIAKLKATISLNVSGTIPLKTKQTFTPKVTMGKGDQVISWKSSNKKAVSVDKNGKIKGLKAGKSATITVQLKSGLKKSFKVKVQKANVATKSLKVTNASTGKKVSSKVSMKSKQTLKLATTVSPVTSKEKVKYSTSEKKIVTVSSKGVITAKKKGKATITVKSGKKTYKIKVTVR